MESDIKVYRWVGPNGRSDMRNRLSAIGYKEGWSRHRGIHLLFFFHAKITWSFMKETKLSEGDCYEK